MTRSNSALWIVLLVASPALADQRQAATTSSNSAEDATARSADKQPILADEHGTLVLARQQVMADEYGIQLLADEHGTLVLARQQVMADEHGTQLLADEHGILMLDMASASRLTEPE